MCYGLPRLKLIEQRSRNLSVNSNILSVNSNEFRTFTKAHNLCWMLLQNLSIWSTIEWKVKWFELFQINLSVFMVRRSSHFTIKWWEDIFVTEEIISISLKQNLSKFLIRLKYTAAAKIDRKHQKINWKISNSVSNPTQMTIKNTHIWIKHQWCNSHIWSKQQWCKNHIFSKHQYPHADQTPMMH